MTILALLSVVGAGLFAFMGGYVLRASSSSRQNRIFALLCVVFTVWNTAAAFSLLSEDYDRAWMWYCISSLGWTVGPSIISGLLYEIVRPNRRAATNLYHFVLYGLGLVYWTLSLTTTKMNTGLEETALGWSYIVPTTPLTISFDIYVGICVLPPMYRVYQWRQRARHPANRAQAKIITGFGLLTLIAVYSLDRGAHVLGIAQWPSTSHFLVLIWLAGIGYAVAKLRLFALSTEMAAENILNTMTESLILFRMSSEIVQINPPAEDLLGMDEEELLGRPIAEVFPDESFFEQDLPAYLRSKDIRNREITFKRGFKPLVLSLSASSVVDRFRQPVGCVAILRDVTERRHTEDKLRFLATHDPLTKLPNRSLLFDRIGQALARVKRYERMVAVMVVDLDHFKNVNDSMGHEAGDQLLKRVAKRLFATVRESDTVARLGGDEFVVLVTDMPQADLAISVAERIVAAVAEPMEVDGKSLSITASVGVSMISETGESIEELLQLADRAMYQAKEERNCFRVTPQK